MRNSLDYFLFNHRVDHRMLTVDFRIEIKLYKNCNNSRLPWEANSLGTTDLVCFGLNGAGFGQVEAVPFLPQFCPVSAHQIQQV